MTIDKQVIERKLKKLQEVITKLEECKKFSREDFVNDYKIYDVAMYNLIMGIEVIVDIGLHILSEVFQVSVDEYRDVIKKLGEVGIISKEFASENEKMASFRNLLVHAYDKLDLDLVYQNLQKAPDVFRKFAEAYQNFLMQLDTN